MNEREVISRKDDGEDERFHLSSNSLEESMIVTAIVPLFENRPAITTSAKAVTKSSRFRIFINDEFAFVLYKGELVLYKLAVGDEITAAAYTEIHEKLLPKRAKSRALHLLKSRRYTEKEIRIKLENTEYPPAVIEVAIEYLRQYNYLDDEQYVRDYIEYYHQIKSHEKITQKLYAKGIEREMTNTIYASLYDDIVREELEQTQISKWLEKQRYENENASIKEKQRVFASLCRRGYSIDTIRRLMGAC
ncbi:MAG: RecX family transcriptional regulator [Lachnospiraceae bacterium]|jgi:regulatory protein|nr:RecX family transcriptional regulator [Lachnospiraceae bacterium]